MSEHDQIAKTVTIPSDMYARAERAMDYLGTKNFNQFALMSLQLQIRKTESEIQRDAIIAEGGDPHKAIEEIREYFAAKRKEIKGQ